MNDWRVSPYPVQGPLGEIGIQVQERSLLGVWLELVTVWGHPSNEEQICKRAALIAAAPRLLEALETLKHAKPALHAFRKLCEEQDRKPVKVILDRIIDRAAAAIAAAEIATAEVGEEGRP